MTEAANGLRLVQVGSDRLHAADGEHVLVVLQTLLARHRHSP